LESCNYAVFPPFCACRFDCIAKPTLVESFAV